MAQSEELPDATTQAPRFEISSLARDVMRGVLASWEAGDVYLQLSAAGIVILLTLCVLICLAWNCYGAEISTVFESRGSYPINNGSVLRKHHHRFFIEKIF